MVSVFVFVVCVCVCVCVCYLVVNLTYVSSETVSFDTFGQILRARWEQGPINVGVVRRRY